jgi:SAM-dependent methyltransferase
MFEEAGVQLVVWNLEEAPYPLDDESFDAVIMTEVFEHLREYPMRSLEEARRVLKPGGRVYFTTPNAAYVMNRLRLLTGSSVATPLRDWIAGVPHARHAREYTFPEILRLMQLARLRVVHVESRHFFTDVGSRRQQNAKRIIDLVARVRPTMGPTIVVVAERWRTSSAP